jgi:hypothetical protein
MNGNIPPAFFFAQYVQAEAVDANLSVIDTGLVNPVTNTSLIHFIPKLASVTGLTAGAVLLCSVNPVVILGIISGDITQAS